MPDVASCGQAYTRIDQKEHQVRLGSGTADYFPRAEADDHSSRHSGVLQGRLQDANCGRRITGWSRRGTNSVTERCVKSYRVRIEKFNRRGETLQRNRGRGVGACVGV